MQLSPIMNLIGGVLILAAIVVHIVCLATPHYAGADCDSLESKMEDMLKGLSPENADDMVRQIKESGGFLANGYINFGLWEMCIDAKVGIEMKFCAKWASSTSMKEDGIGKIESFKVPSWIRGAQSMAILGLLVAVATAAMAVVHMFVPSRGDRLRLLPLFICIAAFIGGAFILCGDIIMAVKYKKILPDMAGEGTQMPSSQVLDVLEKMFFLSWGFSLDVVAAAFMLLAGLFYGVAGHASRQGLVV